MGVHVNVVPAATTWVNIIINMEDIIIPAAKSVNKKINNLIPVTDFSMVGVH
jgi:hypothetical protein